MVLSRFCSSVARTVAVASVTFGSASLVALWAVHVPPWRDLVAVFGAGPRAAAFLTAAEVVFVCAAAAWWRVLTTSGTGALARAAVSLRAAIVFPIAGVLLAFRAASLLPGTSGAGFLCVTSALALCAVLWVERTPSADAPEADVVRGEDVLMGAVYTFPFAFFSALVLGLGFLGAAASAVAGGIQAARTLRARFGKIVMDVSRREDPDVVLVVVLEAAVRGVLLLPLSASAVWWIYQLSAGSGATPEAWAVLTVHAILVGVSDQAVTRFYGKAIDRRGR